MANGRIVVEVGDDRKSMFKKKIDRIGSDYTKQIIKLIDKFLSSKKKARNV